MQELRHLIPQVKYAPMHPSYRRFIAEFWQFRRMSAGRSRRFDLRWRDRYPCLDDRMANTTFDPHYTYHPAWAARIIAATRPSKHVDIGSTLAFCTMVSAMVPVDFYDIRPAQLNLENLTCKRGDLSRLPFPDESVVSLSCMHVIEHVGLGRYGDALDPEGDLKAIGELRRVLARGGSLVFVAPVGRPTVRFNAHRIYSHGQITSYFEGLHTQQFALVDDAGDFRTDADPAQADRQAYGCGCWWFTK